MLFNPDDLLSFTSTSRSPTGAFGASGRKLQFGKQGQDVLNLMVSIHEAMHEYLNQRTAWGLLLTSMGMASQEDPSLILPLKSLVSACRNVHELYATYVGAEMAYSIYKKGNLAYLPGAAKPLTSPEGLLADNQVYLDYYQQGAALCGRWKNRDLRFAIINAVAIAAMQSREAMESLPASLPEEFGQAHFRSRWFPDRRLRVLMKHLTEDFWIATPELANMVRLESEELEDTLYESVCRRVYARLMDVLASEGYQQVGFEEHLVLAKQMETWFEQSREKVIFSDANLDKKVLVKEMLLNETLYFSEAPLPAALVLMDEFLPGRQEELLESLQSQHLILIFRTKEQLLEQYRLEEESLRLLEEIQDGGLHLVRQVLKDREYKKVNLFWIRSPDQCQQFLSAARQPVLFNLSYSALRLGMHGPKSHWSPLLQAHCNQSILLDNNPFDFARAMGIKFGQGLEIWCKQLAMEVEGVVYYATVLLDLKLNILILAPAGPVAVIGFMNAVSAGQFPGFKPIQEDINEETYYLVSLLMQNVISGEHFFAFNQ